MPTGSIPITPNPNPNHTHTHTHTNWISPHIVQTISQFQTRPETRKLHSNYKVPICILENKTNFTTVKLNNNRTTTCVGCHCLEMRRKTFQPPHMASQDGGCKSFIACALYEKENGTFGCTQAVLRPTKTEIVESTLHFIF